MTNKEMVSAIINGTDYNVSCRGMSESEAATTLVKSVFENQNIAFDGWKVVEIPLAWVDSMFPACVSAIIRNTEMGKLIEMCFDIDGNMLCVSPLNDENPVAKEYATIAEALADNESSFSTDGIKFTVDVIDGNKASAKMIIVEKIFTLDTILETAGIEDTDHPNDEEEQKYYVAIDTLYDTIKDKLVWTAGKRHVFYGSDGMLDGDYVDEYQIEYKGGF